MQEFVEYNMLGNNKESSDWQRKEILRYTKKKKKIGNGEGETKSSTYFLLYRTLPPGFQEQLSNALKLRPVYTKRDVENSCAKVCTVSFFQEIVCFIFFIFRFIFIQFIYFI